MNIPYQLFAFFCFVYKTDISPSWLFSNVMSVHRQCTDMSDECCTVRIADLEMSEFQQNQKNGRVGAAMRSVNVSMQNAVFIWMWSSWNDCGKGSYFCYLSHHIHPPYTSLYTNKLLSRPMHFLHKNHNCLHWADYIIWTQITNSFLQLNWLKAIKWFIFPTLAEATLTLRKRNEGHELMKRFILCDE